MAEPLRMNLGEARIVSLDYGPAASEGSDPSTCGKLDAGEKLTGTPTVAITPATSPTLAATSIAVNAQVLIINGRSVPPGEAVQFKLAAGATGDDEFDDGELLGTLYHLKVSVGTTSSPAQTFVDEIDLELVDVDAT